MCKRGSCFGSSRVVKWGGPLVQVVGNAVKREVRQCAYEGSGAGKGGEVRADVQDEAPPTDEGLREEQPEKMFYLMTMSLTRLCILVDSSSTGSRMRSLGVSFP